MSVLVPFKNQLPTLLTKIIRNVPESKSFGVLMKDFCRIILRLRKLGVLGVEDVPLYKELNEDSFYSLRDPIRQRVGEHACHDS